MEDVIKFIKDNIKDLKEKGYLLMKIDSKNLEKKKDFENQIIKNEINNCLKIEKKNFIKNISTIVKTPIINLKDDRNELIYYESIDNTILVENFLENIKDFLKDLKIAISGVNKSQIFSGKGFFALHAEDYNLGALSILLRGNF
jgi:hypothetical protein